jgi:30S ribosomal protein S31
MACKPYVARLIIKHEYKVIYTCPFWIKFASLQSLKNDYKITTMGKGDKRTKKGKIVMGSYGVSRPHKAQKVEAAKKAVAAKKD